MKVDGEDVAGSNWHEIELEELEGIQNDRRESPMPTMLPKFLGKPSNANKIPKDVIKRKSPLEFLQVYLSDNIIDMVSWCIF